MSIECSDCGNKIHDETCFYHPDVRDKRNITLADLARERKYSSSDPRTEGKAGSGEMVNHPNHYTFGEFEVIDVLHDWQLDYPLDNVVKYVARAGKKGGTKKELEDLKKAQFYLNYHIAKLEARSR